MALPATLPSSAMPPALPSGSVTHPPQVANNLVAQMLFLANEDPGKDITLYSAPPIPDITHCSPLV